MCIEKIISRFSSPDRQVDRFLDGTMSEDERDRFEKRCLEDRAFFLRVQERELIREKVVQTFAEKGAELSRDKLQPAARQSKLVRRAKFFTPNSRVGWAYALLALALLSLSIILILPNPRNYAVHPDLEHELGTRILRSAMVKVLSPGVETKPCGEILFAWESNAQDSFQVVVLDNQANEIKSFNTTGRSIRYQPDLAPGLYYWKLLQNDDWIYTGKIIIDDK
ncbi:MAG TPA: hypothetical protein PKN24_14255 [bacterium]|nr:hypothetical protein [bacterium]